LNTNSLTDSKYIAILALTQHLAIDVFILTDTRHLDSSTRFLTSQAKLLLGPHTKVLHSPAQSLRVGKKAKSTPNVGGQIIIVTAKWAGAVSHHYSDPTNLGLVSSVTLSTGSGKLLIFGTYWPYPSDSSTSNGLWNKTSAYLARNKIRKTPRDFIQDILCRKSEKHLGVSPHNLSVVCGDFNHSWNSTTFQLQPWAHSNHWASPSQDHVALSPLPVITYTKGLTQSWIDHFLVSPPSESSRLISTTSFDGPFFADISDHRPLSVYLQVPGGRGTSGVISERTYSRLRSLPRSDFNTSNKKLATEFRRMCDSYLPYFDPPTPAIAGSQLMQASCISATVARRLAPKPGKSNSSYKNGWSPTLIALKAQSMAILQILGHLQGTRGRRIWTDKLDEDIGIKRIIQR
jgi:hypothetical protein